MDTPYEFYKKIHPNQFSYSEIIRASKLDKSFFDYYLNSITSRDEEKKNLLPSHFRKRNLFNLLPL